jgi:predicted MFS family arabinose efflux permease
VQLMRAPGAIVVDAVSFLASAFALWRIQAPEPAPAPPAERQHIVREALEGVQLVAREPLLRSLAGASVLAMLGSNIVSVVFLLYLNRELGFSPGVLGLIFAIGGVTSLAGAYFAGRTQLFGGFGMALVLAAFMRAGGALFMPLTASVSVLGAALLVANQLVTDPAWTFYDINAISLRQAITPDRLQGRMNASMRFVEFGAMLLGTAAGGLGGEWLGLRQMLFAAVGMQLLAACWLAVSPVRKLRTMPVAVEAVAAA